MSRLQPMIGAIAGVAGLALLAGCGSSTEAAAPTRSAGGIGAPDVIAVVCNLTTDVIRTTMTSTKPGKSPADLTEGDCISSRPEDAGGDSQFATSFGDNCGVKATVALPAADGQPAKTVSLGFYSINFGFRGVVIGATPILCRDPASSGVGPAPGSSLIERLGGYPVRVYQWPDDGRYVQVGVYINPPGTPADKMQ